MESTDTPALTRWLSYEGHLIWIESQNLGSPTTIKLISEDTGRITNIAPNQLYNGTKPPLGDEIRRFFNNFQKEKSIEQRKVNHPILSFDHLSCIEVRELDSKNPYQLFLQNLWDDFGAPNLTWSDEKYDNPVPLHINSRANKIREAGWCLRLTGYPYDGKTMMGFAPWNDRQSIADLVHKMLTPAEDLQILFALTYPDIAAKALTAKNDEARYWDVG